MFRDLIDFFDFKLRELAKSRLIPLGLLFTAMFVVLILHLFQLQIVNGESAQEQYTQTTKKTVTLSSTRGNIYDRDGNLLAYNQLVYKCTVTDTGDYSNGYQKNLMLLRLIDILNEHDESFITDVPIIINKKGEFVYTVEGNTLLRFLRDMYGLKSIDDFTEKKPADTTAQEAFEYMKNHYGVGKYNGKAGNTYEVSDADALKCINIRFSMSMNSYQKYVSTDVSSDIKEETMQDILEHSTELLGVDVVEDYERIYNNPIEYSSVIGYTGKASSDDLTELNKLNGNYVSGDVIGKTGIENSCEDQLQGLKGERVMYVDSEGHVTSVESETQPVPGNDVYLTIDTELQIGIYHLIEQQLAGIILDKLEEGPVTILPTMRSSERRISIRTVYYQLLSNNVLDMTHFKASNASQNEKDIDAAFEAEKSDVLMELQRELTISSPTNYKDLDEDMQNYMTYSYNALKNSKLLLVDKIDTTDEVYQKYRTDETMSMQEFLRYALTMSWIDTSKLELSEKYTSAEDTYQALIQYLVTILTDDSEFNKLVYNRMLLGGRLDVCKLCLILYDQGVLEDDPDWIARLSSGTSTTAYQFMYNKISNLQITPAQLALDPCTAAVTVVDATTGDVLAMVSYPGYDTNRISDSQYYYSLTQDQSAPLYSTATQTRTAPGSTYKLASTIAGLTEGKINAGSSIYCDHVFTKVGLNLKCTGEHGYLDVTSAIQHSCNVFFSEVGYRLSDKGDDNYSETLGVSMIQKYAEVVGLSTKSGVEVNEMEPHVSDKQPIPSSIGQGTHAFANVQLARYATTLATRGTVYDLTLLDKTVNADGKTTQQFEAEVLRTGEDIADSTWNVVQNGMYRVTHNGEHKDDVSKSLMIAGKTGTAEENKMRPNHATFVGYAPYDNPKYSFAVTIPYGFSSTYSTRLSNSVMELVEGQTTLENVLQRRAMNGSGVSSDAD